MDLFEALLLLEEKQERENFISKFGEDTYNLFMKSKDRLKNNKLSTDITWHIKHTSPEEMDNMLSSLQQKMGNSDKSEVDFSSKQIPGEYKYFGRIGNYEVYQPLDYVSSMALGVNTGWCTTGRYGHYGDPNFKPSEEDAKRHFNDYTSKKGAEFYYLLNPKTNYGEIAIAKYPRELYIEKSINDGNQIKYIESVNFEIFNAEDKSSYDLISLLPDSLYEKLGLFFNEKTLAYIDPEDETHCIIPDGTKEIQLRAFYEMRLITRVTIPDGVTKIGKEAFLGCGSLEEVIIPDSVTDIEGFAFKNCVNLDTNIPNSVKYIEPWAFCWCRSLKNINIPDGVKIIYSGSFSGCESVKEIIIPEGVERINEYAFECCSSLITIKLPNSLAFIEEGAFRGCYNIKKVYYNGTRDEFLSIYGISNLLGILAKDDIDVIFNE